MRIKSLLFLATLFGCLCMGCTDGGALKVKTSSPSDNHSRNNSSMSFKQLSSYMFSSWKIGNCFLFSCEKLTEIVASGNDAMVNGKYSVPFAGKFRFCRQSPHIYSTITYLENEKVYLHTMMVLDDSLTNFRLYARISDTDALSSLDNDNTYVDFGSYVLNNRNSIKLNKESFNKLLLYVTMRTGVVQTFNEDVIITHTKGIKMDNLE